jgi:DNA-binding XRE family transcriptional regulator
MARRKVARGNARRKLALGNGFSLWRQHCGFSKAEAARALGLSWVTVNKFERGCDYAGNPRRPSITVRRLMSATALHDRQETWPA